jgi:multidrug efflux system outer membrane protein
LGEEPSEFSVAGWGAKLWLDHLPEEVPVGLPSELLERRPDLMQSLFSLEQAAAGVGLARAARLPSFSLTLGGGVASDVLKGLFTGDPWIWSVSGTLLQPVFAFGKLKAQEKIAREKYYETMFSYRQNFLQALSEVDQALIAITTYRKQVARTRELVARNESVLRKTRALYENGMSDYLDVIDAERSYYASELQLVELLSDHYIAYVDLFKALGGGW